MKNERVYKPNLDGSDLRCPDCGGESIIWPRGLNYHKADYGICRDCWNPHRKYRIEKFAECYANHHDQDGEPEYDPCIENGHYY